MGLIKQHLSLGGTIEGFTDSRWRRRSLGRIWNDNSFFGGWNGRCRDLPGDSFFVGDMNCVDQQLHGVSALFPEWMGKKHQIWCTWVCPKQEVYEGRTANSLAFKTFNMNCFGTIPVSFHLFRNQFPTCFWLSQELVWPAHCRHSSSEYTNLLKFPAAVSISWFASTLPCFFLVWTHATVALCPNLGGGFLQPGYFKG